MVGSGTFARGGEAGREMLAPRRIVADVAAAGMPCANLAPTDHAASPPMLIFETPRLHLRPLGPGDEALYCHLYTDAEVMRHVGAPMTADAARRSFRVARQLATRGGTAAQRWVVFEHGSPAPIGLLALIADAASADHARDGNAGTAEVGLMLRADRQRRGVAVAAIGAVANRVFGPGAGAGPGLRLLWARHAARNVAATRLMLRLGFTRLPPRLPGEAEVRWQMPRDRWNANRLAASGGKG